MSKEYFKSYNYLSEADLLKLSNYHHKLNEENPTLLREILFMHGADVGHEFECVVDTHRMRTSNKVYTGKRFVYVERTDKEWLCSGIASMEAYMAATDEDTRKDMAHMSRRFIMPSESQIKE
jgi:hypothetical protein